MEYPIHVLLPDDLLSNDGPPRMSLRLWLPLGLSTNDLNAKSDSMTQHINLNQYLMSDQHQPYAVFALARPI